MKSVLFKGMFKYGILVLIMTLPVMCGTTKAVNVSKVPQPQITGAPKKIPKIINQMTVMINFDFDQSTLAKEDIVELKKVVKFVKKYPNNKIQIDGYSDIIGTPDYNLKLSERRAYVTRDYLINNAAVDPADITSTGRGTIDPIGDRKTVAGRTLNRRAVISIIAD